MTSFFVRPAALLGLMVVWAMKSLVLNLLSAETAPSGFALLLPVEIDGASVVECEVFLYEDGSSPRIRWADLKESFRERIQDETLGNLEAALDDAGYLRFSELRAAGLDAQYDAGQLTLTVRVPGALRRVRELRFGGQRDVNGTAVPVSPAMTSGYLNLRFEGRHEYGRNAVGWHRPLVGWDHAFRWKDWVLEGSGMLGGGLPHSWVRSETRLVRDWVAQRLRLQVGDLRPRTVSFLNPISVAGVSVSREFRIDPFRVTRPQASGDVFVEQDSEVEVWVNGNPIRRLQLSPGPYRVRDLQLTSGFNEVRLVLRDAYGVVQTIDLSLAHDHALLATGESDYAWSIGVPPRGNDRNAGYLIDQPVLTGFHRWGVSPRHTRSGFFQADSRSLIAGADSIWATSYGSFRGEWVGSLSEVVGFGHAMRVSFVRYASLSAPTQKTGQWRVDFARESERFQVPMGGGPRGERSSVGLTHSRRLPGGVAASLGVRYTLNRGKPPNNLLARASFFKRWRRGLSTRLVLDARQERDTGMSYGFSFRLEKPFGGGRQLLSSGYDHRAGLQEFGYAYTPEHPIGSWRGSSDWRLSETGTRSGDFRAGYGHERGQVDLSHSVALSDGEARGSGDIRLSTALAFAGRQWAVSRPIADSFVMVAGHESLPDVPIRINESAGGAEAQLDGWGPAVVSNVQSYFPSSVGIGIPDELPFGYDLGPVQYAVAPTYKSGSILTVGTEPRLYGSGRAQRSSGEPYALQAGELSPLGSSEETPIPIFTSRDGTFSVEGVRPGELEIQWFGEDVAPTVIQIPADAEPGFDLGVVTVRASGDEEGL